MSCFRRMKIGHFNLIPNLRAVFLEIIEYSYIALLSDKSNLEIWVFCLKD